VSAAEWRKAMNSGAGRYAWPGTSAGRAAGRAAPPVPARPQDVAVEAVPWVGSLWRRIGVRHVLVLLAVLAYPWIATPFFSLSLNPDAVILWKTVLPSASE